MPGKVIKCLNCGEPLYTQRDCSEEICGPCRKYIYDYDARPVLPVTLLHEYPPEARMRLQSSGRGAWTIIQTLPIDYKAARRGRHS